MSLAQAKRVKALADFPFPESAHDIYYAGFSDWISYEMLLRFDASEQDCKDAAPKILEWSQEGVTNVAERVAYPTVALENKTAVPVPVIGGYFSNVTWWNGLTIKHGYFAGGEKWGTRQLLIDSDSNRLYFYQAQ